MRDLAKSMMSFTWAMSLFGVKQMTDAVIPGRMNSAADAFQPVTKATIDTFGSTLKAAYQAGDALQRGVVDMMFGMLSGRWNWNQFLSPEARQQAATAAQQAAEAAATGTSDQGWGPVPPPR